MARIRVMLVDDHYLVRVGLANVLGFEADIDIRVRWSGNADPPAGGPEA